MFLTKTDKHLTFGDTLESHDARHLPAPCMTILVRAAGLHGYEALAKSLGVNTGRALCRVGLSSASLADPNTLIPYVAVINLLEHTAVASNCPAFGLRLAQTQDITILGQLAVLIRHASTLAEALDLASRYMFVHSPAVRISALAIAGQPELLDLVFGLDMQHLPPCAQTIELSLGVIVQCMRLLGQQQIRPLLAQLPHARIGALRDYTEALGCPCRFEMPVAAIRIAAADLLRPVSGHNPMLRDLAQSYLDHHFTAPDQHFSDRVRAMVRRFLGTGQCSQPAIAGAMGIHPRTVQRRLLDEGQRFAEILDGVRKEQLQSLLGRPNAPSLSHLALMLGYSEQAALTRSCRRWFGCTPTQLRRQ